MAYVRKLFEDNFLYYASYVIKDRAIPDLEDGFKPVQRRIMHTLFEIDDGKFQKVANVVGRCMAYHPHGDQSIYSALVVLANKELFIDKQGNFGNLYTGDEASAPRYIECRCSEFAKAILYNPKITEYVDSYDGRHKEPVVFPAKVPIILIMGAEGIAVGMSTKILPHNPVEVIKAEINCLRGKKFELYPDFPTGGLADVSEYADGQGKVRVRAKVDLSDPKRIIIRELPFGSTTESLIQSVENAAKAGRIKIASISDYTTSKVEIEIRLQRGVYAEEVLPALYAFTECEASISCNFLVIRDGLPVQMTVSDALRYQAKRLLNILKSELEIEESEIKDEIHARTLERIFIEERVYKKIESKKSQEGVNKAVIEGLEPYKKEIQREVTLDDVERLLKIPIRRISLYDIEKAQDEMRKLEAQLKQVRHHLNHLTDYAVEYLQGLAEKLKPDWQRKTELTGFSLVDVKEAAKRDVPMRYDGQSGYLGTGVSTGEARFNVSTFDKVLLIRRSGIWSVVPVPEKLFVDQGLLYCSLADKEAVNNKIFTLIYKDSEKGFPHIKRFKISGWIMNKDYPLIPDGAVPLWFTAADDAEFTLHFERKPRQRIQDESFKIADFDIKGIKAGGVRLASKVCASVEGSPVDDGRSLKASDEDEGQELFDEKNGKESAGSEAGNGAESEVKTQRRKPPKAGAAHAGAAAKKGAAKARGRKAAGTGGASASGSLSGRKSAKAKADHRADQKKSGGLLAAAEAKKAEAEKKSRELKSKVRLIKKNQGKTGGR